MIALNDYCHKPINNNGYTLIELIAVIAVIGIVLAVAAPATRNALFEEKLNKTSRQFIGLEKKLRGEAVRDQVDYQLIVDLPGAAFWVITADMTAVKQDELKKQAKHLPEGVRILDIVGADNNKISESEAKITFGKNGISTPAVVHLADEEKRMTLVINPFLGITDILDQYIDYSFGN